MRKTDTAPGESLLDEREVAALLRLDVETIRRRRYKRLAPAFIKIGASVRYRRADIDALIESGRREPVQAA